MAGADVPRSRFACFEELMADTKASKFRQQDRLTEVEAGVDFHARRCKRASQAFRLVCEGRRRGHTHRHIVDTGQDQCCLLTGEELAQIGLFMRIVTVIEIRPVAKDAHAQQGERT
jgi:hypothetical protein